MILRTSSRPLVVGLVAGAVAVLLLAGLGVGGRLSGWLEAVRAAGPLAPLLFIAVYAVAVVGLAPGSVLTLAAGALFGLVRGTLYAFIGATLGATLAFVVARRVARPFFERRFGSDPRLAAVDRAIASEGRKVVLLLRLSPVIPFNVLNYVLGLTRVRPADYVLGFVGMLPATVLYVYYGKLAGDLAAISAGQGAARGAGYYVVLIAGLAATVLVTVVLGRRARRELAAASALPLDRE
jgi:uncharacterized membrane protein YdjX (TVP38/TMEM64 family)